MVRTACQQASGWGAFGVDRYMHLLRSMVLVCLVNDTQARGALGPRLETITRLGLTVAFIIGLHGHGPMVCLELSALGMSRFHNDKMAELSRLLDYEFPVGHSEYACKLHKMSEVPSVIGAEHNGHPVSKNMRMTLVSPVALCRLLPRLARLPSFKKDNLLQHWLHGGVGSPLEFVLMRDFRRLPEDPTALEMLVPPPEGGPSSGPLQVQAWQHHCSQSRAGGAGHGGAGCSVQQAQQEHRRQCP